MTLSHLKIGASERNLSRLICPAIVLAVVTLACVNLPTILGDGAMPTKVTATDVQKFTVYHSPQTPGYTCWVGTWLMPDEALMISFHQSTGPFSGRPRVRKDVQKRLNWPRDYMSPEQQAGYDMTGTVQQIIHMASTDGGPTWERVNAEPYHTPMNGCNCQAEVALPDGTIVRGMNGHILPFYDVPQTAYIQRSTDSCQTWSEPVPVMDSGEFIVIPKRLRLLKDGRLVLTGGLAPLGPDVETPLSLDSRVQTPTMWTSSNAGQTWSEPIAVLPAAEEGISLTEECDFAELPDGRLLFVSRVSPGGANRWQSLLAPEGDTFRLVSAAQSTLPYSGHPEMLWAREGVALHLATSGIDWTADAGATWHDLGIGGTGYYPRSVQLPDGTIFCVYHRGGDDPYDGSADQEIQAMTFRLQVEE